MRQTQRQNHRDAMPNSWPSHPAQQMAWPCPAKIIQTSLWLFTRSRTAQRWAPSLQAIPACLAMDRFQCFSSGNCLQANDWLQACDEHGGYGATAARLTPDQKVGSSNLSALNASFVPMAVRLSGLPPCAFGMPSTGRSIWKSRFQLDSRNVVCHAECYTGEVCLGARQLGLSATGQTHPAQAMQPATCSCP